MALLENALFVGAAICKVSKYWWPLLIIIHLLFSDYWYIQRTTTDSYAVLFFEKTIYPLMIQIM